MSSSPKSLSEALRRSADDMMAAAAAGDREKLDRAMKINLEMWEIIGADCEASPFLTQTQKNLVELRAFVRLSNLAYVGSPPQPEEFEATVRTLVAINKSVAGGIERRAQGAGAGRGDMLSAYAVALDKVKQLQLQAAVEDAVAIAEIKGESAALHTVIGIIQCFSGDLDAAAESFETACGMDAYAGEARNSLLRICELKGDAQRREQHLAVMRGLLSTDVEWQDALELTQLAAHTMSQGHYEDAFALAQRSAALAPWMTDNWWIMSFMAHSGKEFDQAVELASEAVIRNAADARLRHHLVSMLYSANRSSLAIAHHRQGTLVFSDHPDKQLKRFFSR